LGWFFLTWRRRRKRRKINEKRKKNAQETGMTSSAIPNGYKLWVIVGRLGGDSGAASQGQRRWWRKCLVVTSWGTCRGITVLLCPCPLGIVWARLKGHRVGQGSERHVSVPSEVSFFSIFVFQRLWPSSLPFIECHLCRLRCIFTSCNKGWWKNSRLASLGHLTKQNTKISRAFWTPPFSAGRKPCRAGFPWSGSPGRPWQPWCSGMSPGCEYA